MKGYGQEITPGSRYYTIVFLMC